MRLGSRSKHVDRTQPAGFTLVELLVVIAIIGILVALLLPAIQAAREAVRRTQCSNNLKQLALALQNYHDTHNCFPPNAMPPPALPPDVKVHRQPSWFVRILPYIEQGSVYDQLSFSGVDWSLQHGVYPHWEVLQSVRISMLNCPTSPLPKEAAQSTRSLTPGAPATIYLQMTNYVGIGGTYLRGSDLADYPTPSVGGYGGGRTTFNGVVVYAGPGREPAAVPRIIDGTSNTLCIGEQSSYYVNDLGGQSDWRACNHDGRTWSCGAGGETDWWLNTTIVRYPINYNGTPTEADAGYRRHTIIRSAHAAGANLALADGSVRFISDGIDFTTWMRLCDREDRSTVGDF